MPATEATDGRALIARQRIADSDGKTADSGEP
jgi:hypothetical protein